MNLIYLSPQLLNPSKREEGLRMFQKLQAHPKQRYIYVIVVDCFLGCLLRWWRRRWPLLMIERIYCSPLKSRL